MNPLLLAKAAPYALAAMIAFGLAWGIQSLRLTHAQQELTDFKQEQTRILQEHENAADLQRNKASEKYAQQSADLEGAIRDRDVLNRCIAAGKCGRVQHSTACSAGIRLPATSRVNETGGTSVPSTGEPSAENSCEELANMAARVQLEMNNLQVDIESQPGYDQ